MSTSQRRKPLFMPNPDPATIIVPGVDSNAPPAVQLEQIEQLITLRLATIDDNLARSHQIITTQILPAVQRFARASQPTRDSARFWRSFFEAAAQVQVPTGADYSMTETERDEGEMEGERTTTTEDDDEGEEHTVTTVSHTSHTTSEDQDAESQSLRSGQMPSEHSFAGVVASTPARGNAKRGGGYGDTTQDSSLSSEASWTPSHGTMLNVLNQQIREGFKLDERAPQTKPKPTIAKPSSSNLPTFMSDISSLSSASSVFQPPTPSASGSEQSLHLVSDFPARILMQNKPKASDKSKDLRQNVLRRGGTPKLARYNPFLDSAEKKEGKVDPLTWDGMVDLSSTSSLSSHRGPDMPNFSTDDSSGMSGVIGIGGRRDPFQDGSSSMLLQFPPAEAKLVGTPAKKAAGLMVADMLAGLDIEDSPSISAPTPPSLAKYRTAPGPGKAFAGLFGGPTRPTQPAVSDSFQERQLAEQFPHLRDEDNMQSMGGYGDDSFSDEGFSGEDYGAQPQESMHSIGQGQQQEEGDSFDSEDSDVGGGMVDYGGGGGNMGGEEDEDTLFGPRGNPPAPRQGFHLDAQGMRTWMGGRLEDAVPMQGSPTPFAGDFVPLDRRGQR